MLFFADNIESEVGANATSTNNSFSGEKQYKEYIINENKMYLVISSWNGKIITFIQILKHVNQTSSD